MAEDKTVNNVNTLCVETYTQIVTVSEDKQGAAYLGVALNDASDQETVHVCVNGITTIKLGNTITNLNCGFCFFQIQNLDQ